jgi:hypothetical protein
VIKNAGADCLILITILQSKLLRQTVSTDKS